MEAHHQSEELEGGTKLSARAELISCETLGPQGSPNRKHDRSMFICTAGKEHTKTPELICPCTSRMCDCDGPLTLTTLRSESNAPSRHSPWLSQLWKDICRPCLSMGRRWGELMRLRSLWTLSTSPWCRVPLTESSPDGKPP